MIAKYSADNFGIMINSNKSVRFEENFDPSSIRKRLENFYFDKFRKRLFSAYLTTPSPEVLDKIFAELMEEYTKRADRPINSTVQLENECFNQALNEISQMLECKV